jgi:hypothetical protein
MKQIYYRCCDVKKESFSGGIDVEYDDGCLTITRDGKQTAITAYRNEIVIITVCDRVVRCEIKGGM